MNVSSPAIGFTGHDETTGVKLPCSELGKTKIGPKWKRTGTARDLIRTSSTFARRKHSQLSKRVVSPTQCLTAHIDSARVVTASDNLSEGSGVGYERGNRY